MKRPPKMIAVDTKIEMEGTSFKSIHEWSEAKTGERRPKRERNVAVYFLSKNP